MVGQLFINGLDAWLTYGVVLEAGSKEALLLPAPIKELPSNDMAGQHGIQYFVDNMRIDKRDLSLTFCFIWHCDYMARYTAFVNLLQSGPLVLKVSQLKLGFNLIYNSSKNYESIKYAGKLSVQFTEPNPKNRILL